MATDGWSKLWRRKIDGKAKSENDKGSLGARLIHDPVVRACFLFFFFLSDAGVLEMESSQTRKGGGSFSLLGHGVCGRLGQSRF